MPNRWQSGHHPMDRLQAGDPIAREAILAITHSLGPVSDRVVRWATVIELNLRVQDLSIARMSIHDTFDSSQLDPAELWVAEYLYKRFGDDHRLFPVWDEFCQTDHESIVASVAKKDDPIVEPAPLLTVTAGIDLLRFGKEEPRMLKGRPRKWSVSGLRGVVIPRDPILCGDDSSQKAFKLEWTKNTTWNVKVISSEHSVRGVRTYTLDPNTTSVAMSSKDLHNHDWFVHIVDAK